MDLGRTIHERCVALTILIALCVSPYSSAQDLEVGDPCRTSEGFWGVCTLSRNCGSFALNPAVSAGDVCASSDRRLIICCSSAGRPQPAPARRTYGGTLAADVSSEQVLIKRSTTTRGPSDNRWWLSEGAFEEDSPPQPSRQTPRPWWAEMGVKPFGGGSAGPVDGRPNRPFDGDQGRPNRPFDGDQGRPNRPFDGDQGRPNRPFDGDQGRPNRPYNGRPDDDGELIAFPGPTGRPKETSDQLYIKPLFKPSTELPRTKAQRSISEIKCDEYSQQVWRNVSALPLVPDPEPVSVQVEKCNYNSVRLIVGGDKTTPGEFPHMAALGYRDGRNLAWNCGGTLISEYYVLTAAHCIHTGSGTPAVVRLGEYNLYSSNDGAQPVDYTVSKVIRHPEYKLPAKYNDIGLLRLSRRVFFNKFIRPACLYTKDFFTVDKTTAIGWGRIDYAESASDVLLKVSLSIIDNNKCNQLYRSDIKTSILAKGILPSMLCAGDLKGGKDTCQGDSGGPIQISSRANQCIHYIIGITSFGKFCAGKNAPGVYTRVSNYVPWIESIVWPSS